jgi:hypothetical protein
MAEPVWSQFIPPETILEQVRNTAPFLRLDAAEEGPLVGLGGTPTGYLRVLSSARTVESLEDYFALCCAAHQATVATFVPTDVDSKIRGVLWNQTRSPEVLERMAAFTLQMKDWTTEGISTRVTVDPVCGPVSGHNGEWFSVPATRLGGAIQRRDCGRARAAGAGVPPGVAHPGAGDGNAAAGRFDYP